MIDRFLGNYEIVKMMSENSIAKRKNRIVGTIFYVFCPIIIKLLGYPSFQKFQR
jgi:hypothetical protein